MKSLFFVRPTRTLVALATILALTACGGGGGNSAKNNDPGSDGGTPTSVASEASVSGVAAKGLLQNALVTAYSLVLDTPSGKGVVGEVLAQVETNSKGEFTLTGLPAGTPVIVRVSRGEHTLMVDEATNTVISSLPDGLELTGAIILGGKGTVSRLHLTPFSNMAFERARTSLSGLTVQSIEDANAEVRSVVQMDVISGDAPTFSDDGMTPKNAPALLLAAVSRMALDNTACHDTDEGSTGAKIQCTVNEISNLGILNPELVARLNTAIDDAKSDEHYDQADVPALNATSASKTVVTSAVGQIKALHAALTEDRALLLDNGPGSLTSRIQDVKGSIAQATSPLGESTLALLQLIQQAVTLAANPDPAKFSSGFAVNVPSRYGAGCAFYKDDSFAEFATSAADVKYLGCSVTHLAMKDGANTYGTQHLVVLPVRRSGTVPVRTALAKVLGTFSERGFFVGADAHAAMQLLVPSSGTVLTDGMLLNVTQPADGGWQLDGDMAPDVNEAGMVLGDKIVATALKLKPTQVGTQTGWSLTGDLSNINKGAVASALTLKTDSYLVVEPSSGNWPMGQAHLVVDAETTTGAKVVGIIEAESGASFTMATQGTVSQSGANLFIGTWTVKPALFDPFAVPEIVDGIVVEPAHESTFAGDLFVTPTRRFPLSLTFWHTSSTDVLIGSLTSGGTNLSIATTRVNDVPLAITIQTDTGLRVFIDQKGIQDGTLVFPITKSGVPVAQINWNAQRVEFLADPSNPTAEVEAALPFLTP